MQPTTTKQLWEEETNKLYKTKVSKIIEKRLKQADLYIWIQIVPAVFWRHNQ